MCQTLFHSEKCIRYPYTTGMSYIQSACLFACLFGFVHLKDFSLIRRAHHCLWRLPTLTTMHVTHGHCEVRVLQRVKLTMTRGIRLKYYNYNTRGPLTLPPVAKRLVMELTLPFFTTKIGCNRGSNPDLPHARQTLFLYAISFTSWIVKFKKIKFKSCSTE